MKYLITLSIIILSLSAFSQKGNEVLIEGGTFTMGRSESTYIDEYPNHRVTLKSFYIGKYEVTVEQYSRFSGYRGLPGPVGEADFAASNISWRDAVMYCNWLSSINNLDNCYTINPDSKKFYVEFDPSANGYRLPTEAEWEYAARGGVKSKYYSYSGSNNASEVAWSIDTGRELKAVGQKQPNELGLYDMSGNCSEWCWDIYRADYYKKSETENPTGPKSGSKRVSRGGGFTGYVQNMRVTDRDGRPDDYKNECTGFRIARNK